ncbi:MAG: molybdopterin-guanine dinucleotide biosynthesis protein B [Nitrospirae bacterium]|nr:molybdopterin-guanine dinucleotide biosynthesis protein B [Nitrospirota bacterium]
MKATCVIGIAGYSGSGKTTLIRKLLPALRKQGLSIGILKHIHHKLKIDMRGKDTDLLYRAGADFVSAHDDVQGFARYRSGAMSLAERIARFPSGLDLILVEGHKDVNVPGIWLQTNTSGGSGRRSGADKRLIVFRDDPQYHVRTLDHILLELERYHTRRPVKAGLLIGGSSSRMGQTKSLLKIKGRTLATRSFGVLSDVSEKTVLLGSGQISGSLYAADRLADVPGVHGPLAGMLSAFRWSPDSAWIISSVDMPLMNKEAWKWLLSQRRPGAWAVLPKIKGSRGVETTGAVYEPMIVEHVESMAADGMVSLQDIAKHKKVITPMIPESLSHAWTNVNTPGEWGKVLRHI